MIGLNVDDDRDPAPDALLPLPPATFHILLAVADDERHGYGIIQDVAARTNGSLRLSPGTLYRSIQRMLEPIIVEPPKAREVCPLWIYALRIEFVQSLTDS